MAEDPTLAVLNVEPSDILLKTGAGPYPYGNRTEPYDVYMATKGCPYENRTKPYGAISLK